MVKVKGNEDFPIYFGTSPEIMKLARELRKTMTPAERQLWRFIRNRKLSGFRFRRQHPIYLFIADFYCHDARLAVEVDGNVHNDPSQCEKDIERTVILNSLGIKVIRFTNHEIETCIEKVLNRIEKELQSQVSN